MRKPDDLVHRTLDPMLLKILALPPAWLGH